MKEYILNCISLISGKDFRYYFVLYSSIFVISAIITAIIGLKYTKMPDYAIYFMKNYTSLRFGDSGFISILSNNFFIVILMMYFFYSMELDNFKIFLGKFYFLYMGSVTGLIISKSIIKYNLVMALSLVVPHGIIEISTMIFAISFGWALSGLKGLQPITPIFITISLAILILLTISAYIEAHVTLKIFEELANRYSITI